MAANGVKTGDSSIELPKDQETQALLRSIVYELKNISVSLARHEEQLEAIRRKPTIDPDTPDAEPVPRLDIKAPLFEPSVPSSLAAPLSYEARTGPILRGALSIYNLNVVPLWSDLYGSYVTPRQSAQTPEEVTRNLEWASVIGDCWKIPNDGRIHFCFGGNAPDISTVVRVRNFVSHLHGNEYHNCPKGRNFNVWDWFDTGISENWYPGKKIPFSPLVWGNWSLKGLSQKSNSYLLPNRIAPWRRIINMKGLTTVSNCGYPISRDDFTDQDLCPFVFESKGSIFQEPIDEILWRIIKCHLRCLRVSETEHIATETKGLVLFHITFYEILDPDTQNIKTELWPCGELHSDHQQYQRKPRRIRESALTLLAVPSVELRGPRTRAIFWTILCMLPDQFPHPYYFESKNDLARGLTHEMLDDLSGLVHRSLVAVVERWERIADYFEGLLGEKSGLLNPDYHDSLLTDDRSFTRSKRCFWVVEFLKETESSISDNIQQTRRFIDLLISCPPTEEATRRLYSIQLRKHHIVLRKLEILRRRFRIKQEEAKSLRDGLFSASSVMESRAATQLGENVKLLTYISIFFLPLSFCTSVWSINDQLFSLSALAIVIPSVALFTYIVVLNLSNISRLFNTSTAYISSLASSSESPSLLRRFINSQIRSMQHDYKQIWRDRGAAFSRSYTLRSTGTTPSHWRIVQYSLRQLILKTSYALASIRFLMILLPQPLRDKWRERAHGSSSESNHPLPPENQVHLGNVRVHIDVETIAEPATATPPLMRDPNPDNESTPDLKSSNMLSNISHVVPDGERDWSGQLGLE